jgi:FKBP-type peptidyl-prolyl cis-trans isomerase SlyD
MTHEQSKVSQDMVVGLDYTLRLDDGEMVDTSAGRGPLQFLQGHGQIVPGLEKELYGMAVGEEKAIIVSPSEGYGQRKPNALQEFPRDAFPEGVEIQSGMAVQLMDQEGRPHMAFVSDLREETVLLDLNHPLAGETLHFDVEVVALREATEEELAHGHVH